MVATMTRAGRSALADLLSRRVAAWTVLLAVAAGLIGVDRWAPRWDLAFLVVGFTVGWIPGAIVAVAHAVPHVATGNDVAEHLVDIALSLGVSVLAAAILRHSPKVSSLPRRRASALAPLVIVVFGAAAIEAARTAPFTGVEWIGEANHIAIGLVAAAFVVALPRPIGRNTGLWAPSGALLAGLITVLITVGIWDQSDKRSLVSLADSTSFGFLSDLAEELNVLTAKADTSATTDFTFEAFPELMQTVVFGHEQISAAALVTFDERAKLARATAVSDLGPEVEDTAVAWLTGPALAAFEARAAVGDIIFLGVTAFPNPVTDTDEPQLVYAVPLRPGGTFDPKAPCYLVGAISVPVLAEAAAAPSITGAEEATLSIYDSSSTPAELVWSPRPDAVKTVVVGTAANASRASAVAAVADREFVFLVERGERFGTPLTTRRLAVFLELFAGIGLFVILLQTAHSRTAREAERRSREALLAAALSGTPGWTAVVDPDGVVVVGNNDPSGSPIGASITAAPVLAADEHTVERIEGLVAEARSGKAGSLTFTSANELEPDQPLRIYEVSAALIPGSTDEGLVFFQCIDVTEKRERAMRTAQSERMESIGVLAGSLAHDFNNLLFITLGYLQMMERQPSVSNDAQLSKFVGRATEAVQRGATIAKSLLSVARSQPMAAVPVNLRQFVADLDPLLQQSLPASTGVQLHVEVTNDHLEVLADPGRFSSAVLNLVFNARDAMEGGGDLTIRTDRVTAEKPDGTAVDAVVLAVSDTGRGMSPEVTARAFEPFFTTNKVGKGTGLGLAAVYSFAQQSGGWASIESREGVGTTVSIFLPPHTPDRPLTAASQTASSGQMRALVVDDEKDLADLVAAWLGELGFETRIANNSAEAFTIAEEFEPTLLLSDSNLGEDLDGAEVATRLTSNLPNLVVVFMTGFSDRLRALDTVGAMTLAKPFSRDDLSAAIIKVLGVRRAEERDADGGTG